MHGMLRCNYAAVAFTPPSCRLHAAPSRLTLHCTSALVLWSWLSMLLLLSRQGHCGVCLHCFLHRRGPSAHVLLHQLLRVLEAAPERCRLCMCFAFAWVGWVGGVELLGHRLTLAACFCLDHPTDCCPALLLVTHHTSSHRIVCQPKDIQGPASVSAGAPHENISVRRCLFLHCLFACLASPFRNVGLVLCVHVCAGDQVHAGAAALCHSAVR